MQGTLMSTGAVCDRSSTSSCSSSLDEMESTLAERSGTSDVINCEGLICKGGAVARCG